MSDIRIANAPCSWGTLEFEGLMAAIAQWLHLRSYRGWIVAEQDVLPGMGSPKASAQRNRTYLRTIGL